MKMYYFPKEHELIKCDIQLSKIVKNIESYREIIWEMNDIKNILESLIDLYPNKEMEEYYKEQFKDIKMPEGLEELAREYNENRNSFQIQRDCFDDFVNRMGKLNTLMLLSPKLALSLEQLFAGTIITYVKSFNQSTGRSKLNINKITNDINLINLHQDIIELRNKHYAHVEYKANMFYLKYAKIDNLDISIDKTKFEYTKNEFHQKFDFSMFIKLINTIIDHLKNFLNKQTTEIEKKLTSEQKELLLELSEYDAFNNSGHAVNIKESRTKG